MGWSEPKVRDGAPEDFDAFLRLAAEVEHWFGPMVHDPGFNGAVQRSLGDGRTAALVATDPAGEVIAGLMFRHHDAPIYEVGWIVVTERYRSRGVGKTLLREAFRRWVRPPAEVIVATFGADHRAAPFRRFYEGLGFVAAEPLEQGPEGGSRQRFRLSLQRLPQWVGGG